MDGRIIVMPHTGTRAVHDNSGRRIAHVEHDTGLKRIYYVPSDGVGQQIGFLHPNGFMHFVIPEPPKEFADWVRKEVEVLASAPVKAVGAPPPIAEDDE